MYTWEKGLTMVCLGGIPKDTGVKAKYRPKTIEVLDDLLLIL